MWRSQPAGPAVINQQLEESHGSRKCAKLQLVILAMRRNCFGAEVSYPKEKRKRKTAEAIF